ncbi:hybrid sensor histidine kinase/response regulator [Prolixibacter bellariivorans]|nr:PAS domain S-box protein [Prolixibacter bellariivorans]
MKKKSFILRKPSDLIPSRKNFIIALLVFPLLFSLITLVGWISGADTITRWHPRYIPMAPSTAISFILLFIAVFLPLFFHLNLKQVKLARIPVFLTALISLLVLVHFISGSSFNFETLIVSHPPEFHGIETARMSPATAIFFFVTAITLFLYFSHNSKLQQTASLILTISLGIILLFDLGYLFGTPLLYEDHIIPPAANTVISLTLLSLGILLRFGYNHFPIRLFTGKSIHAKLLRAFLPPTIFVLLTIGIIESRLFWLSEEQVVFSSLVILTATLILGFIIMRISRIIGNDIDHAFEYRAKAESKLRESEERFRKSISQAPFPAFIHSDNGQIISLNNAFTELTGYTTHDIPTMEAWISLSDPKYQEKISEHVNNLYQLKERIDEGEFPVFTKENKVLTWDFSTAPLGKQPDGTSLFITMAKDTTERKKAERLLKEQERWLKESQRVGRIGSYNINLQNWTWTSSEIFDEIFGIDETFDKNMNNWLKLIHPDQLEELRTYFDDIVGNRESFNKEYKINRQTTGEERWIWSHGEVNYSDTGEPLTMIGTIQDITERKYSEYQIEKSLALVKATLESTADGILVVNNEGKIMEHNQKFAKMWNIPEHIFTSQSDEKAINYILNQLKKPDLFVSKVMELYANPDATSFDTLEFIDGRIFERYSKPLRINDDSMGRVWSFRDVTEPRIVEQSLKKTQLLLKSTIESARDIIIMAIDTSYRYLNFNHAYWLLMKSVYNVEITPGMNLLDFVHSEEDIQRFKPYYDRALHGESHSQIEKFSDGDYYETFYNPIVNEDDETIGATAFSINITDKKKAEAELIQAKELAEENNRLKTAFLHNISHEIRTPMNAIIGFSELLCDEEIGPDERGKYAGMVFQAGEQLLSIITDIINIATIESGQVKINQHQVNLNQALKSILMQFQMTADQKQIELRQSTPVQSRDISLVTDEIKLIQILTNLIGNALKFTESGYVDFNYRINEMYVEFHIEDTGKGIPEELQEKIFERFQQADSNISREFGGAGLGLAISKAYIELLGGRIWLKSEPGKGAVFTFTIPYIHPDILSEKETTETSEKLKNDVLTILVAENEEYSFLLLKSMLPDYRLIRASDDKDTLRILRANPAIDMVFFDVNLKEDNEDESIKRIKAFRPKLPVLALTSYGQNNQWDRIHTKGFDEYIKRPFRKEDIISRLKKFVK